MSGQGIDLIKKQQQSSILMIFIAMIQVRIHGVMYQSLICLMVQLPVVMLWPLV